MGGYCKNLDQDGIGLVIVKVVSSGQTGYILRVKPTAFAARSEGRWKQKDKQIKDTACIC